MHRRPPFIRRAIVAIVAGSTIALGVAGPASASFSSSMSAYPITSACIGRSPAGDPTVSWRGGATQASTFGWYPYTEAPHGTMYFCYATYRLGNKTSDGDYYAIDLKTVWSDVGIMDWMKAVSRQSVSSNKVPKDSVYDWTTNYTSSSSCSAGIYVGVTGGPISVGTTITACSGQTINLESHSSTSATWRADYVAKTAVVETSYYEKVTHGVVPTFTFTWKVPYYSYSFSVDHWVVTAAWDTYTRTATGTA